MNEAAAAGCWYAIIFSYHARTFTHRKEDLICAQTLRETEVMSEKLQWNCSLAAKTKTPSATKALLHQPSVQQHLRSSLELF